MHLELDKMRKTSSIRRNTPNGSVSQSKIAQTPIADSKQDGFVPKRAQDTATRSRSNSMDKYHAMKLKVQTMRTSKTPKNDSPVIADIAQKTVNTPAAKGNKLEEAQRKLEMMKAMTQQRRLRKEEKKKKRLEEKEKKKVTLDKNLDGFVGILGRLEEIMNEYKAQQKLSESNLELMHRENGLLRAALSEHLVGLSACLTDDTQTAADLRSKVAAQIAGVKTKLGHKVDLSEAIDFLDSALPASTGGTVPLPPQGLNPPPPTSGELIPPLVRQASGGFLGMIAKGGLQSQLKKVDVSDTNKTKRKDLVSSFEETMKMALAIRKRAIQDVFSSDSDDSGNDSDSDEWAEYEELLNT
eukprot:TRINITY_DN6746_c0_g1_i1.p1 TRINITY_DN6746_c0_g1~~TRINITY_DN6746_c0_g1_i1.p1  ORF type:complete len:355 (-),score=89.96 TRINITY_DN6746_c0_g1_i1:19-1083(-)